MELYTKGQIDEDMYFLLLECVIGENPAPSWIPQKRDNPPLSETVIYGCPVEGVFFPSDTDRQTLNGWAKNNPKQQSE